MKLKPVKRKTEKVEAKKEVVKKDSVRNGGEVFPTLFPPIRFLVRETSYKRHPEKVTRQYLEISVKRVDEGVLTPPFVFVSMYQEGELYTGYLKNKSTHFPLRMLYEVISRFEELEEECEKWGVDIFEEVKDKLDEVGEDIDEDIED